MRRLALVLLVLASATVHAAADTWTYGVSEHFEVYTTGNAGRAREALRHFESVHAFLASFLLKRPLATATRTRLIIFSNDRQFAPYRPSEAATAFYVPSPDRDYIVMSRFDPTATQIVVHEYVHLLLKHSGGRYPVWLNEGLAEFFSTMLPESGRMVIGEVPPGRLPALVDASLIPISRLLAVNHDSPEYNSRAHSGLFYAQSWALTHMILAEDTYRPKSDAFFALIAKGALSSSAFMQLYRKTPEVVERDLRNYLTTTLRVFGPSYQGPPARTTYETRVVDAFEADLVIANLLASTKSEPVAREAFVRLEQQKPDDVALLESRAYFELRRGHRAAAALYFERAVAHGTRNVALMRDYLVLDPTVAEAVVPKALALAPDDVDIRIEEAALLTRQSSHRAALVTLTKLRGLTRAQGFRAYQLLANIYVQLEQFEEARAAAAKVAELARNGRERTFASQLNASVEKSAGQKAAFDARTRAASAAVEAGDRVSAPQAREAAMDARRADAAPATPALVEPSEAMVTVTGRIRSITSCTGGHPVLEVLTNGRTVRLFVDDPVKVFVRGRATHTVDLSCGTQDTPVTVSYVPAVDKQRNTAGHLRILDYSK
jgi:hypothetical protein